jgi:hypothetical protein
MKTVLDGVAMIFRISCIIGQQDNVVPFLSSGFVITNKACSYIHTYIRGPLMVAQWLRYCATNRQVAGSIPDGVIGIFH